MMDMCNRITSYHELATDLFQETLLVFLEMDEQKVISLSKDNHIVFYFYTVAKQQWFSKRRQFNKKYRHLENDVKITERHATNNDDNDIFEMANRVCAIIFEAEIEMKKNGKYPYPVEVFKAYILEGSALRASKDLGIPYRSVADTIKNFKKKIGDIYYGN